VNDVVLVGLAGLGTALATGLGAVPVFALRDISVLRPLLWGAAAGVMTVVSVQGLAAPALDTGSTAEVATGLVAGVLFLALVSAATARRMPSDTQTERDRRAGITVFVVLLVHSLPEGLAIGAAAASERDGLGLFVITAIALQNIPEGTSTALPMAAAGFSPLKQTAAAIATSLPQPPAAVGAYLLVDEARSVLPWSLAFAAGAMLAVVARELLPRTLARESRGLGLAGLAGGGIVMALYGAAVGV
jgi:ZIP family zinc transporter